MPNELQRVCEYCGGQVVQCLECTQMLHCVDIYRVGTRAPLCVLCAAKHEQTDRYPKERLYA